MRTNTVTHSRSIIRDKATWAAYGLLTVYTFFLALIGPLLPHLRADLGLSYAAGALHTSAFAAGVIVSGLLGEVVIERFGRRRAAQFALAGIGIGFQLVALAPSAAMSITGSAMMGLVGTLILVVVPAVLAEQHGDARGLAFTEANILSYLGALAAPLTVWCVVSMATWRSSVVPAWAVLIVTAWAVWAVPFPVGSAAAAVDRDRLPKAFWAFWTLITVSVAAEFCLVVWSPSYLESALGLSRERAAVAVMAFPVGIIAGRAVGAFALTRVRDEQVVLPSLTIAFCGFVLFWSATQAGAAMAGLLVTALGVANLFPVSLALAIGRAGSATNTATARSSLATGVALIAAPLTLGGLADQAGIRGAFALVPLLLMAGAAALVLGQRLSIPSETHRKSGAAAREQVDCSE
jgi:MFS transporter, DHA1 family, inner membrane transport protein